LTTDGTPRRGLYPVAETGADPTAAVDAAQAFLAALSDNERMCTQMPLDSDEWRMWTNAFVMWPAKGVRLERISAAKRDLVLELMRQSLSEACGSMAPSAS
jgi:hypothetical protein